MRSEEELKQAQEIIGHSANLRLLGPPSMHGVAVISARDALTWALGESVPAFEELLADLSRGKKHFDKERAKLVEKDL